MDSTARDFPRAVPDRDPTDAEVAEYFAQAVLDDLPGAGLGCATTDQRLAAAQVHAELAISRRLAGLTQAVESIGVTGAALTGMPS